MKTVITSISTNIKFKIKTYTIDNVAFKFHYKLTTMLLFIFTIVASSQELIGEHIKCIADKGVEAHVINTFCFFTSTFTVLKYLDADMVRSQEVAHPGVGAMGIDTDEPIQRHAYYQWVPFFIFFQALCFYVPHMIWKRKEKGRMKKLVSGLEMSLLANFNDQKLSLGSKEVPSKEDMKAKFAQLQLVFKDHLVFNKDWTRWLTICELLNLLNIIAQVWFTQIFLDGQFLNLGIKLMTEGLNDDVDVLDVVFPKMTKCTFHKYGPSGTIQSHDAMCVMASNVINEKLFCILWFWYAILFAVSVGAIVWRVCSMFMHASSSRFTKMVFQTGTMGRVQDEKVQRITRGISYGDWLFLVYMMDNMDDLIFVEFINFLSDEMEPVRYDAVDNTLPLIPDLDEKSDILD